MQRFGVWLALLLAVVSSKVFSAEFAPIYTPPPHAYGVSIEGIRGDDAKLYLWTSARYLIAIDKQALLTGSPSVEYLSAFRWDKEFSSRPTSAIEALVRPPDAPSFSAVPWRAGTNRVHIKSAYCEEGTEEFHELRIDGLQVDTGMDPCMDFTDPVLFDGNVWMGTYTSGEYSNGPGIGVLVFDLQRRKRVFQIRKSLGPGDKVSMLADEGLGGVWIVNRSAIHFYNREFQLLAKWYYSEQMDTAARNWSILALSKRPKPHDAFAVLGRIINTPPERESGDAEKLQQPLNGERWVTTKGIAAYQRYVEGLPSKVRNGFWLHYDDFERRIFPMWRKDYMVYGNGGKGFLPARELAVCLHVNGEGGRSWGAEDVVQRIVVATQPDAQAHYVDPPPPLAASKSCPSFR